ncbi:MAG TPA: MarR family transcriptional regulator [Spirochaetia bacterium]|nr:MarR family transcriptional regulator [Spirochaetia bacterium]
MSDTPDLPELLNELIEVFMRGQMAGLVRYARSNGLSMSQISTLFRLHGHGHHKGVSDIGDHLGVTSAAASQLLDRLVQNGLIVRSEDPEDRRAKRVTLTGKGSKIIEDGMKGRQRWFASMADAMTEDERAAVFAGMKILIGKIKESVPDGDPFDLSFQKEESTRK